MLRLQQIPKQHAYIKFLKVTADIKHTSPKYTCHKLINKSPTKSSNPDIWVKS